jgi:hypothetical protein
MSTRDEIKKELEQLIAEHGALLKLTAKDEDLLTFGTEYQNWYTRALRIVQALAPDRLAEFIAYYQIDQKRKSYSAVTYAIQDYIMGRGASTDWQNKPLWDTHNTVAIRFYNQVQILNALNTRIDSVLSDVTGALFAELQDHELNSAQQLLKISVRAAGALAGVVLERHLRQVVQNHKITLKKKTPTIADLNDALKKANVYDTATWRKVQLLGDIRNLCSHQKGTDPTKEQVEELIAGANAIVKTVF